MCFSCTLHFTHAEQSHPYFELLHASESHPIMRRRHSNVSCLGILICFDTFLSMSLNTSFFYALYIEMLCILTKPRNFTTNIISLSFCKLLICFARAHYALTAACISVFQFLFRIPYSFHYRLKFLLHDSTNISRTHIKMSKQS